MLASAVQSSAGALFSGAVFRGPGFSGAVFKGAVLSGAVFMDSAAGSGVGVYSDAVFIAAV